MSAGLLRIEGLGVALAGRSILDGVSFELGPGVTALLGPNGCGKTTLLRALLGLLPAAGRVEYGGRNLLALPSTERARVLAYVPQRSQLEAAFTVRETVALGCFARGQDPTAVEAALADCDLLSLAERPLPSLSGGERARVLIARALAACAPLLLADEPGAHLDMRHQLELFALLRRLAQAGRSVLVVLHDLQRARDCADRALLLDGGRIVADGPAPAVLDCPRLAAAFGVRLRPNAALGVELLNAAAPPAAIPLPSPAPPATGTLTTSATRQWLLLAAAFLCAAGAVLLFSAPGSQAASTTDQATVQVQDASGRLLPVAPYRRIASTALIADAVLPLLVERERLLSRSRAAADYPWAWRSAGLIELEDARALETLLTLRPDLVLVGGLGADQDQVRRLREAGLLVFDLGPIGGLDRLLGQIRDLSQLLAVPERGETLAEDLARRHRALVRSHDPRRAPRALYLSVYGDQCYGATRGTSLHDVLRGAGLRDAAAEAGLRAWPQYRPEDLLALDPDLLIAADDQAETIRRHPQLRSLRALRRPGHLITLPRSLLDDPGPAQITAAERLREKVDRLALQP